MSMINPGRMGVLALVLAGSMQAQEVPVPQHNVELPGVTAESSSGVESKPAKYCINLPS